MTQAQQSQNHTDRTFLFSGSSSVAEHRLAKARAASSNLVFRSNSHFMPP